MTPTLTTAIAYQKFQPAPGLSEETFAFSGILTLDGVPVAYCSCRGHGDGVNYQPIDPAAHRPILTAFEDLLRDQPPRPSRWGADLRWDLEDLLSSLAITQHERKAERRRLARQTWVRFAGATYEPGAWSGFKAPCTPAVLSALTTRHGPIARCRNHEIDQPITIGSLLTETAELDRITDH